MEGRLRIRKMHLWLLLDAILVHPREWVASRCELKTVKILPIVNWALISESNAVFINCTDFKKQSTINKKE